MPRVAACPALVSLLGGCGTAALSGGGDAGCSGRDRRRAGARRTDPDGRRALAPAVAGSVVGAVLLAHRAGWVAVTAVTGGVGCALAAAWRARPAALVALGLAAIIAAPAAHDVSRAAGLPAGALYRMR
jgi:hypothetical protein